MSASRALVALAVAVGLAALLMAGRHATGEAALTPAVAEIDARALAAFEVYTTAAEERFAREAATTEFLSLRFLEGREAARANADLARDRIVVRRLRLRDATGEELRADGGRIHHWIGTVFVPGATLETALEAARDYDDYARIYAPEILASSILERVGPDRFRVHLRIRKKKVVTVTLDTEHDVLYARPASDRAYSMARATRVRELEDAGTPEEREKADGDGFLWRINTTWRYLEADGGLYLENESVSLTRSVPFLLRLVIGPLVNGAPREGVEFALTAMREELLARATDGAMAAATGGAVAAAMAERLRDTSIAVPREDRR